MCCGQPWKWHMFWKRICDGLCRLQMFCGFCWNIKSSFNRKPGPLSGTLQAGAWVFPPTCRSIWVVLWVLLFRSGPSTFPQRTGHLLRAISGCPWSFRLHWKSARSILALKLSVTTTNCYQWWLTFCLECRSDSTAVRPQDGRTDWQTLPNMLSSCSVKVRRW